MKNTPYALIIERDAGGYYGFCPQLHGSYTVGLTYQETLKKLKDNVRLHLAAMPGKRHDKTRAPMFVDMTWEQLIRNNVQG